MTAEQKIVAVGAVSGVVAMALSVWTLTNALPPFESTYLRPQLDLHKVVAPTIIAMRTRNRHPSAKRGPFHFHPPLASISSTPS